MSRTPDRLGCLALHNALELNAPLSILNTILQQNDQAIHVRDKKGYFPIHLAAMNHKDPGGIYRLYYEQTQISCERVHFGITPILR